MCDAKLSVTHCNILCLQDAYFTSDMEKKFKQCSFFFLIIQSHSLSIITVYSPIKNTTLKDSLKLYVKLEIRTFY